ncbi:hypothetical protein J1614_003235 [Plenodomus biglobosus]|nr:hypothetical protein J1614_003235 [Plenodomus biglobosus]
MSTQVGIPQLHGREFGKDGTVHWVPVTSVVWVATLPSLHEAPAKQNTHTHRQNSTALNYPNSSCLNTKLFPTPTQAIPVPRPDILPGTISHEYQGRPDLSTDIQSGNTPGCVDQGGESEHTGPRKFCEKRRWLAWAVPKKSEKPLSQSQKLNRSLASRELPEVPADANVEPVPKQGPPDTSDDQTATPTTRSALAFITQETTKALMGNVLLQGPGKVQWELFGPGTLIATT